MTILTNERMKFMKKVILFMLMLVNTVNFSSTVYASDCESNDCIKLEQVEENQNSIKNILVQLGDLESENELMASNYIAGKLNNNCTSIEALTIADSLNNQKELLEKELCTFGVTEMSSEEVNDLLESSNCSDNQIKLLSSSSNCRWWTNTVTKIKYNNKYYDVKLEYAEGQNLNCNLNNGGDGVKLYNKANVAVDKLSELASIYVQKAIGQIPIICWTPYELLFSNNTNVTSNSHNITYRSTGTVCFAFVKLSSESAVNYIESYASNSISIASTHVIAGYKNGTPFTKSTNKTNSSTASTFASVADAIKSYAKMQLGRDFIENYSFYNWNKQYAIKQSLVQPVYPSQVLY